MTIGAGGVENVLTGGGDDRVTTKGDIGSLNTGDGADKIVLAGSAGLVRAGGGDDVIITRGQWIELVHLGAGDDVVKVKKLPDGGELRISASSNPANGEDTLDLSGLRKAVTVELGTGGAWQDIVRSKKIDAGSGQNMGVMWRVCCLQPSGDRRGRRPV